MTDWIIGRLRPHVWPFVRKHFGRPPLDTEDYIRAAFSLGLKDLALADPDAVPPGHYISTDSRTVRPAGNHMGHTLLRGDTYTAF